VTVAALTLSACGGGNSGAGGNTPTVTSTTGSTTSTAGTGTEGPGTEGPGTETPTDSTPESTPDTTSTETTAADAGIGSCSDLVKALGTADGVGAYATSVTQEGKATTLTFGPNGANPSRWPSSYFNQFDQYSADGTKSPDLTSILAPACGVSFDLEQNLGGAVKHPTYYWMFLPTTVTADTVAAAFTTPPTTVSQAYDAVAATGWTRFDSPSNTRTTFRSATGQLGSASIVVATVADWFPTVGMNIDVPAEFGTLIEVYTFPASEQ
jgi:hypothetical protein